MKKPFPLKQAKRKENVSEFVYFLFWIFVLSLLLLITSCTAPDDSILEPEENLICVECFDQINHIQIEPFCGSEMEADKFIIEAEKEAHEAGIMLHCEKCR